MFDKWSYSIIIYALRWNIVFSLPILTAAPGPRQHHNRRACLMVDVRRKTCSPYLDGPWMAMGFISLSNWALGIYHGYPLVN